MSRGEKSKAPKIIDAKTLQNFGRYEQQSLHPNQDRISYATGNLQNPPALNRDFIELADQQQLRAKKAKNALWARFKGVFKKAKTLPQENSGATFVGLVYDKNEDKISYCNLGDSRAYIVFSSQKTGQKILVSLTEDMKPDTPRFKTQIAAKGGEIIYNKGVARVEGLAVAGAFGDLNREHIIRNPEYFELELKNCRKNILSKLPNLKYLPQDLSPESFLLASDGFCDVEQYFAKINRGVFFDHVYQCAYEKTGKITYSGVHKELIQLPKNLDCQNSYSINNLVATAKFASLLETKQNDDITIIQLDLKQAKSQDATHTMVCLADGHGFYGHQVAQNIVDCYAQAFCNQAEIAFDRDEIKPNEAIIRDDDSKKFAEFLDSESSRKPRGRGEEKFKETPTEPSQIISRRDMQRLQTTSKTPSTDL